MRNLLIPPTIALSCLITPPSYGDEASPVVNNANACSNLFQNVNSEDLIARAEVESCKIIAQSILTATELETVPALNEFDDIRIGNSNITLDTEIALNKVIPTALEKRQADRLNAKSDRFIRGCFNADREKGFGVLFSGVLDSCALRRSNTPNTLEVAQPAQFSFTRNLDAPDGEDEDAQRNTFEIAAAFRGSKGLNGDTSLTLATEYQRNNTEGEEQANLTVSFGAVHDISFSARKSEDELLRIARDGSNPYGLANGYSSLRFSGELSYNRMGIFGDPDSDPCMITPEAEFCGRQNLDSARFTGNISPYASFLNGVSVDNKTNKSKLAWAVSPVIGIFYDRALNDDVVLASGEPVNGGVFGVTGEISASLSPGIFRNRWQLSASAQIIEALDRSPGRVDNFEDTSRQFTSTLSYAFLEGAYVGQTQSNRLIPAISFTYTNGSDSLRGRSSRETFLVSLTLLY